MLEADQEAEKEKQAVANEKAKRAKLEAAATLIKFSQQEFIKEQSTQTDSPATKDVTTSTCSVQTEENLTYVLKENEYLKKKLQSSNFRAGMVQGDDSLTHQYTGLPTWGVFLHLVMFLTPFSNTTSRSTVLTTEDEIFLTLVRLRLALFLDDLANRFDISTSTVSRIFQKWLDIMYSKLSFLITWPSREIIRQNMPPAFKSLYPKCCCIIDCSEVFIEMPASFSARSQNYSDYKKHNTFKFLIGITPCGGICFLSKCWGGRVSDKQLTQESNFFSYLEDGDVVLADRGFTISEDLAVHGAKLEIPAFTRGKSQLSQREVEQSKQLSMVRIHVERIIGLLKNKYTLLKGPVPVNLLKHRGDNDVANIDKILVVCSALTNLHKAVV